MVAWLSMLVLWILAVPVSAEIVLPPGFTRQVYVSGRGFDRGFGRDARGIPVTTTLGLDRSGALYLAKSGNRYSQSRFDGLLPIYRIPPGGARMTPHSAARYAYGPPLRNPEVGTVGAQGELFVTTYDPDRQIGVLYRMTAGRPVLFAGGTPPKGRLPLLKQPEGVALDSAGNVYVADRVEGRIVKLDPTGRVLDPSYLGVTRPRALAVDPEDHLWIGSDGSAPRPWQEGSGEIWRVSPRGEATRLLEGPHAAAISVGPAGVLFVAQRQAGKILILTPKGRRVDFARFTGEAVPRSLAFAPPPLGTEQAGMGGDLFVVTLLPRTWYVNDVIRISGPFGEFVRQRHGQ